MAFDADEHQLRRFFMGMQSGDTRMAHFDPERDDRVTGHVDNTGCLRWRYALDGQRATTPMPEHTSVVDVTARTQSVTFHPDFCKSAPYRLSGWGPLPLCRTTIYRDDRQPLRDCDKILRRSDIRENTALVSGRGHCASDRTSRPLQTGLRPNELRALLWADVDVESIDFRSLRDSYATWCALAAVPDKRIQRRLGHVSGSATTDKYIKVAESFDVAAIGEPFPTLPEALLDQPWTSQKEKPRKVRGFLVARARFTRCIRRWWCRFRGNAGGERDLHATRRCPFTIVANKENDVRKASGPRGLARP